MRRSIPAVVASLLIAATAVTATAVTATAVTATAVTAGAQAPAKTKDRQPPAVQKPAPRPAGGGLIDINRATPADLEAIPGIGKAYAAKIIAGRPYSTKAGLVQKNILSAALYEKIKDRIIAKQ